MTGVEISQTTTKHITRVTSQRWPLVRHTRLSTRSEHSTKEYITPQPQTHRVGEAMEEQKPEAKLLKKKIKIKMREQFH